MHQPDLLELAKQGNPQAIATLINNQLNPKGIFVKANTIKCCLQIIFEATEVPQQEVIYNYIYAAISKLKPLSIEKVIIYGKQIGNDFPLWQQEFEFRSIQSSYKETKISPCEVSKPSAAKNYECHGDTKILILKTDGVLIKKLGKLVSSEANGENFISFNNILNIQFRNSSSFLYGFIYFQLAGCPGHIKHIEAPYNHNTVVFIHDKFSEFDNAKFWILEKINSPRMETYTKIQPIVEQPDVVVQTVVQHEVQISCPKCGSTQITSNKKGFNVGQALIGGFVTGGVGLVAGLWGSNEIRLNCLRCGNRWKPER